MIRNARTYSPHLSMQGKPHFFRLHCDSQTNSLIIQQAGALEPYWPIQVAKKGFAIP